MLNDSEIRLLIVQTLSSYGWSPCDGYAICLKSFDSAVGKKEASVSLSKGDGFNRTLSGYFLSEGRNALEPSDVLIPIGADFETVRGLIERFATVTDRRVSETYAVRLYRSKPANW